MPGLQAKLTVCPFINASLWADILASVDLHPRGGAHSSGPGLSLCPGCSALWLGCWDKSWLPIPVLLFPREPPWFLTMGMHTAAVQLDMFLGRKIRLEY